MTCPKCGGSKVVTDRSLDPPHTCTECWRAFEDKDIPQVLGQSDEENGDDTAEQLGEVIGWRAWYIVDTPVGPRLKSLGSGGPISNTEWMPGNIEVAECPHGLGHRVGNNVPFDEQVPVGSCSCGFYAAVSREHLISLNHYHLYDIDHGRPKCIGQIAMSGKVIPGTQGWKAQEVWPVKLYVPFEFWRYVKPLQEAYGIPVELSRTLEDPSKIKKVNPH